MNLNEAMRHTKAHIRAGNAVEIISPSGVGKSESAIQLYKELNSEEPDTWGLGVLFGATQTPPDLVGYQFKGEREIDGQKFCVTEPSMPLWMQSVTGRPATQYKRYLLILEEADKAEGDVKKCMAEIFLNLGTPPWMLPEGSAVLALSNKGARYGSTKQFDFVINRRFELHVQGDVRLLLDYLDKPYIRRGKAWQTMPITRFWIKTNPTIVFEPEPKEQGPWCTARSLCAWDRYAQEIQRDNGGTIPLDDAGFMEASIGGIGHAAAQSLFTTMKFQLELPHYEDIIADPQGTPIPSKPDMKMLLAYELAGWTNPDDKELSACIAFMERKEMPPDLRVTYVSALLGRDWRAFSSRPPFVAWVSKYSSLFAMMTSLLQGRKRSSGVGATQSAGI